MPLREFTFISYAHEDLNQVRKLYEGLKKRKVIAWFDKEDMVPGRWKDRIEKAISMSRYFIFCLSEASLKKTEDKKPGFVDKELQIAWKFASEQDETVFAIIPVRLEDCNRGDMRLSGWQQYDLFEDWDGVLDKLAVHLGGVSLANAKAKDERTEIEKMFDGLMGKAEVFYCSGDYENALSWYEAAINIKPDDHKAWYRKGGALHYLVRHEQALEACKQAIVIKPDSHDAWNNKGVALADLGRYDEAIAAYNKAIEIKPDYHEAWNNIGKALADLGRHEQAIAAWNKAIEIKPDYPSPWYNLACAYSLKKEKTKALEYFQKTIDNGFNNISHINKDKELDFIRNEKEFKEIIEKMKK